MKQLKLILGLTFVSCAAAPAFAQEAQIPETREYSRKGEISPNTEAPSLAAMVAAIEHGSPERIKATLEYGERVLCEQCVPLLEKKLLSSDSPRVREMAAWWLRRQPFAAPHLLARFRKLVINDAKPERRARAAEALGEFMDWHALGELSQAALEDAEPEVRVAAVRGLARLNSDGAGAVIPDALKDDDASVRRTALGVLITVGSFRDYAALLPLLGDKDADVRTRAATLVGEYRVADAAAPLSAMLLGDGSATARKAAAWALGRIGGGAAQDALLDAKDAEQDRGVLNAIDIASRMR
ncbi:MAG TPA: HEAT repeat domain-containing protein [Polyangiales bacterium]